MGNYNDLIVWQKSMDLVEIVYKLVRHLPREETYGLSDQMRRAVVSIPSNIAEGHGRNSRKEFIRFLLISQGSRAELETQLHICVRLGYLQIENLDPAFKLCFEIDRMLNSLIRSMT